MKKQLAKVISIMLGPIFLWPITLYIIVLNTGLTSRNYKIISSALFFLLIVAPFLYIYFLYKKKLISDLDVTKRQQRVKPLALVFGALVASLLLIYLFGTKLLLHLFIIILILFFINFIITLFWKISLHMALDVTSSIIINYLFAWRLPILYLFIPFVFWSRLYLKKHDVWQLLVSFILNGGLTLIMLKLFNYV